MDFKPDSFIPDMSCFLYVLEVESLQHDPNPKLTISKIHDEDETEIRPVVLMVERNCKHDFHHKQSNGDNPYRGVWPWQWDMDDIEET